MTMPHRSLFALALLLSSVSVDAQPDFGRRGRPGGLGSAGPDGLERNEKGAFPGYTLLAPMRSTKTHLLDMQGAVVHTWECEVPPGQVAYLLENGNLLRAGRRGGGMGAPGEGGLVQLFDWEGKKLWEIDWNDDDKLQHHDLEPMPNGNVMILSWDKKSKQDAIAAGRDPRSQRADELWSDSVYEVKPIFPDRYEVVWEWHAWDHLVQDTDFDLPNFGAASDHAERIDVNGNGTLRRKTEAERQEEERTMRGIGYLGGRGRGRGPGMMGADWLHLNSVDYDPELDVIVLSSRHWSELWIVDHSTTIEEARMSQGGKQGRGGDLLYRFGNPQTYGGGTEADRVFHNQHDVHFIAKGLPGAHHILLYDNGSPESGRSSSSVLEIELPFAPGKFPKPNQKGFPPAKVVWSIDSCDGEAFFSPMVSGAERLPNGNTLICVGAASHVFEVTKKGKVVWNYGLPNALAGGDDPAEGFGPGRGRGGDGGPPADDQDPRRGRRGGRGGRGGFGGPMGPGGPGGLFRATRYATDDPRVKRLNSSSK
ncbi:MAG: aryl-sulfate sulfotransferase [Planctomycetes bacterium]|nr:aryl-sulfate sulfotransferase [Planctomycetota bacterium]